MVVRSVVAILVIALAGLYAGELRAGRAYEKATPDLSRLPRALGEWHSQDFGMDEQTARVLDADETLHRTYRHRGGSTVSLFVAYFAEQQVNSQIHSPRNCLPGAGWNVASLEKVSLDLGGQAQSASLLRMRRQGIQQDVVYWFRSQGGTLSGEYALKWDLVKNSLAGRPSNAAFIRFSALAADSLALREVMTLLAEPMDEVLGEVGL